MAKAIAGPGLKLRRAGRSGRRIVELGPVHAAVAMAAALGLFGSGLGLGLLLGRAEPAPVRAALTSPPKPTPSARPEPALAVGAAVSVGGAPPPEAPSSAEPAPPAAAVPEPARLGKVERSLPERGYGLQLGAFDSEAEALRFLGAHAEALAERTVYVVPTEIAGRGTWYRVRVGAEKSRREAEQLRGKLGELGAEALVVSHR